MQNQFWPFLVGNGKYLPHQVIVAPRFLCEAHSSGLLATITAIRDEQTPDSQAYVRLIVAPENDVRNLTVIFRAVLGRQAFLGQGDGGLKDEVGRSVVLFEGLVARGHLEDVAIEPHTLEAAHRHVLDAFRQFWESRHRFETVVSEPMSLALPAQGDHVVRLVQLQPYSLSASSASPPPSANNRDPNPEDEARQTRDAPFSDHLSFFGHTLPLHIADCANTRLAPENTIEACALTIGYGADALAIDVQTTRDGELIAFHDATLERTTNGKGRVSDYTIEQLRKLDAGYTFTPDSGKTFPYRGQGISIPSLRMIYQRFPAHLLVINLTHNDAKLPHRLRELLGQLHAEQRTLVTSLVREPLQRFRGLGMDPATTAASPAELARWLRVRRLHMLWLLRPQYDVLTIPIAYYHERLSPQVFSAAHKSRLGIYLIVDQLADMHQSVDWDIDGIVTSRPDLLEQAFQHLRGDLERLMNRLRTLVALKQQADALALARLIAARRDAPAEAFQIRARLAEEAGFQAEAREAWKIAKQLQHHATHISPSA